MKTCNDCLHYGLCNELNRTLEDTTCVFFEDKLLFIKLPCPVGAKVYRIVSDGLADWPDPIKYKVIWDSFRLTDIYDLGKTVFLIAEEAEYARKQKENKQ